MKDLIHKLNELLPPAVQLVMYGRETRDLMEKIFIILNVEPNILAIVL